MIRELSSNTHMRNHEIIRKVELLMIKKNHIVYTPKERGKTIYEQIGGVRFIVCLNRNRVPDSVNIGFQFASDHDVPCMRLDRKADWTL